MPLTHSKILTDHAPRIAASLGFDLCWLNPSQSMGGGELPDLIGWASKTAGMVNH